MEKRYLGLLWCQSVLAAMLVSGCAGVARDGVPPGEVVDAAPALRASGNEPFWRLDADGAVMTLSRPGEAPMRGDVAGVRRDGATLRYFGTLAGKPWIASVTEAVCRDSMSGMAYPWRVRLDYQAQGLDGCGGEPASLLQGAEWVVEDIGGGGIIDRSRVTLQFAGDALLSGRASCNAYRSRYTLTGEGLRVSEIVTTRMACAPSLMQQEAAFLQALRAVSGFSLSDEGALRLELENGRQIVARRERP